MKKIALLMTFLLSMNVGFAGNSVFGDSIYNEIVKSSGLVEKIDETSELPGSKNWYLNIIRINVNASIGVQVPWLAGLSVSPFVEVFFIR